ncbi:MAG: hypothetical protein ACOXZ9_10710 [Bacteroidales bacterium]|jgi:hypothetical protein
MKERNDILLNDEYDLDVSNGDFICGDALNQRQALLLGTAEGEWKQSPIAGVGLWNYLLDEDYAEVLKKIREQFKADGFVVSSLIIEGNEIKIKANYA